MKRDVSGDAPTESSHVNTVKLHLSEVLYMPTHMQAHPTEVQYTCTPCHKQCMHTNCLTVEMGNC